jgi:NADPH:quinone reductase-like Zn-dependent oxidoreductase
VGGNEGVGRVVEAGPGVTGLKPGQSVLLPVGSGTWTTHMLADAKALVALPEGADFQQLSMLSINPPTAALLLSDFVELQPGEWVVQNAANSAVGGYLVQLARARGLRTVNVVRRESARAPWKRSAATSCCWMATTSPRACAKRQAVRGLPWPSMP